MTKHFNSYSDFNLSDINKNILECWKKENVFQECLKLHEGKPTFVFFEGPPSANGHPGIHHVLARTIKDAVLRYKSMKGYYVPRKAGWDTHGLPVELSVEKTLGIKKEDIGKKISVDDYNRQCRLDVMKYTAEWRKVSEDMGYWVDLDHPYITYENSYIESLWWLLQQLYKKGLLYKGYTIQPYSPAAGTGLSSHELNQPGCYRDVKDTTVTALFKIAGEKDRYIAAWTTTPWTLPSNTALCVGNKIDYVEIETINPYTDSKIRIIMAEQRLAAYLKSEGENKSMNEYKHGDKVIPYNVIAHYKGEELVGMKYEQLMPWVKPMEKLNDLSADYVKEYARKHEEKVFSIGEDKFVELSEAAFRVISGDYVTTEDGTGIVHIAPTFGADDAKVAKDANIPSLLMLTKTGETRPMVDLTGKYFTLDELAEKFVENCIDKASYSRHAGDYVKNAYDQKFNKGGKYDDEAAGKAEDLNIVICMEMKASGIAYKIEKHVHNYPHCWRTDKPILYYPLDSWFIRSSACKQRMTELNDTILWKPESTGSGRFGKWLENLNDWNLSRSRYWGTPLPIWRNAESREEICIGSIKELYEEIEKSVKTGYMKSNPLKEKGFDVGDYSAENYHKIDLHRPYVDDIILVSKSGKPMKRETDLIDVWFDSGAMPYAQIHYPFENKEKFDKGTCYPADFIAEGVDQTRGWFYTLHALATMIFDSIAYKSVISNGLVQDKNGNKMSKRLGNAVDPFEAIDKYGSDPLRWYMITNSSPWDNLKFDGVGVQEIARTFFAKIHQTYSFFVMYANVDGFTGNEEQIKLSERNVMDRWVLSALNTLVNKVNVLYDDYDLTGAGRLIEDFCVNDLSNWYVRLDRKRFWSNGMTQDKLSAYQTLYKCLDVVAKLIAPLAPFYADKLYRDLHPDCSQSVHLTNYPQFDSTVEDVALEEKMQKIQKITSMTLSLRKKAGIIVRQPLQCISIPVANDDEKNDILTFKDILTNELNVKEIRFVSSIKLEKTIKCNFRVMGKKFGKLMGSINKAVQTMTQNDIEKLEKESSIQLIADGETVNIEREDVEIFSQDIPGWSVVNEGNLTVALDLTITDDLKREGVAREVVKRIQNFRKENGFEITDHISVSMEENSNVHEAVEQFKEYICTQILCDKWIWKNEFNDSKLLDFEDFTIHVNIEKI